MPSATVATAPRPRRGRPLRVETDEHPIFITSRVLEERFWLHPILSCGLEPPNRAARRHCAHKRRHAEKRLATLVARVNAGRQPNQPLLTLDIAITLVKGLVGSALARAQQKYGVTVYALVVMSNHLHLLCHTPKKNLAAFMGYFKARITKNINLLTGRRGPLWARRYDAQPVTDDHGCAERMGYLVGNPKQANLVDDSAHWPGLNLAYGFADADDLDFTYLDLTAWHRKKRPEELTPFLRTATLTLSPIPSCEGLSRELCRKSLLSWMQQSYANVTAKKHDLASQRPAPALGVDKVIDTAFDARPKQSSFSRRPYAFGLPDNVRALRYARLATQAVYRERAEQYRSGLFDVDFPEGTYRPPLMRAA